jgi:hypothetical protein
VSCSTGFGVDASAVRVPVSLIDSPVTACVAVEELVPVSAVAPVDGAAAAVLVPESAMASAGAGVRPRFRARRELQG